VIPLTLDASVIVRWFHPTLEEADLRKAQALRQAYAEDRIALFLPPHWRAEVAAVLSRLSGAAAQRDVADLCLLDVETLDSAETYVHATRLAASLSQHVFDTLYHAVALAVPGCRLITADTRYLARSGRIVHLSDWSD